MAFVVEDGTGINNANSYTTVQEFRDYCADRGIDVVADTDAQIQGNLISATDYIDLTNTYKGEATFDTQALQFPRTYDDVDYSVPTKVKYATIEMALSSRSGSDLFSDSSGTVTSKREKVGPIETELDYADSKALKSNSTRFPKVNDLLKNWVDNYAFNSGQLRVISG